MKNWLKEETWRSCEEGGVAIVAGKAVGVNDPGRVGSSGDFNGALRYTRSSLVRGQGLLGSRL